MSHEKGFIMVKLEILANGASLTLIGDERGWHFTAIESNVKCADIKWGKDELRPQTQVAELWAPEINRMIKAIESLYRDKRTA